jgi:hypothetical protein
MEAGDYEHVISACILKRFSRGCAEFGIVSNQNTGKNRRLLSLVA